MRKFYYWENLIPIIFCGICFLNASCAYRLGSSDRGLPGGYRQVSVPMFKNYTMEPTIEKYFTNSLIQEFERSKVALITDSARSEVEIIGEITSLSTTPDGIRETGKSLGTQLGSIMRLYLTAKITLRKQSDKSVLWEGEFTDQRSFSAAQVLTPGVNTVNPLYNLSAKRQNIELMAQNLMSQAYDRLTENF